MRPYGYHETLKAEDAARDAHLVQDRRPARDEPEAQTYDVLLDVALELELTTTGSSSKSKK